MTRLSHSSIRIRQRAAVVCCIALALASGLGFGLIVREARHEPPSHDGKLARHLLVEIERIHASACDEARGLPVVRPANTAEPLLLAQIEEISRKIRSDVEALEAEAIRFGHSLDRVSAGIDSSSHRADLVMELDARRDALEDEVQALMANERAALRAERRDALDALGRVRIVLAVVSVLGLMAGILLAILAWTVPPPRRGPPIEVIATEPQQPEREPELLR